MRDGNLLARSSRQRVVELNPVLASTTLGRSMVRLCCIALPRVETTRIGMRANQVLRAAIYKYTGAICIYTPERRS